MSKFVQEMEAENNSNTAHQGNGRTEEVQEEDSRSWENINNNFLEVQKILEENKILIGEINHNQESKIPEKLARNVALIKELNSNMNQVVGLYSDLASSFANYVGGPTQNFEAIDEEKDAIPAAGQKRERPN